MLHGDTYSPFLFIVPNPLRRAYIQVWPTAVRNSASSLSVCPPFPHETITYLLYPLSPTDRYNFIYQ